MDYKPLLNLIKEYDTITLFRHSRPDCDAVGSQLGMATFIKDNFPGKRVYVCGSEKSNVYPVLDNVSDIIIKESLAIILDTANRDRIDDRRCLMANKIVKIDHHPVVDIYGDLRFENDKAAACTEIVALMLNDETFSDYVISKECATYLYSGLVSDTLKFSTTSTSSETLKAASILSSKNIYIYEINNVLFSRSYDRYRFITYMRTKIEYENGLAVVIFKSDEYEKYNIDASTARNYISELGFVTEFKIWAIFTQNEEGAFDGSLRSQKGYVVNKIAGKYHGGGHENAAGVKNLSEDDLKQIRNELLKEICD